MCRNWDLPKNKDVPYKGAYTFFNFHHFKYLHYSVREQNIYVNLCINYANPTCLGQNRQLLIQDLLKDCDFCLQAVLLFWLGRFLISVTLIFTPRQARHIRRVCEDLIVVSIIYLFWMRPISLPGWVWRRPDFCECCWSKLEQQLSKRRVVASAPQDVSILIHQWIFYNGDHIVYNWLVLLL